MTFYAHTAEDERGNPLPEESGRWQPLSQHLCNVAELAKRFAAPLRLGPEAEIAALLHDLGKYACRFQRRLRNKMIRGINHWAAGAAGAAALKAWSAAFASDGHHTGMPSLNDNTNGHAPCLRETIKKFADASLRLELTGQCPESSEELLASFKRDGLRLPEFSARQVNGNALITFVEALRMRMVFSCLVDADFLDTEQHFHPQQAGGRVAPELRPEMALQILLKALKAKPADGPVNALRRQLLDDALKAAASPPGLFTLTAPTGSGKTLSSLAFALKHIETHSAPLPVGSPEMFRRVIVVIPFTSVIEQTARVYRELFEPEFGPDYVLEHHSAVAPRERKEDSGRDLEDTQFRRARLAAENWASPLIITTNVQFFESLFSDRPSDCRKLHNIGRSVVLFDEVQTLPSRLVPSLLSAVRLLTREYGVTAVFMTATQPAFATLGNVLPYGWNPVPIATNESGLAEALRRTRIELPAPDTEMTWAELAQRLIAAPQSLCVVNTTKDARALFQVLCALQPEGAFHLSARMCPAHRQERLRTIRQRLKDGPCCRLVSTQLIEAGVDVDFPVAFRALGPLDSIIQTAGRCNREGRHQGLCPVNVFRPKEGSPLPKAYEQVMRITESFLARSSEAEARIHQPSFYAEYFAELYKFVGRDSAEADPVFSASAAFDFPNAAAECKIVGSETRPVIVKWKRGEQLAEKLQREQHLAATECREAQRYSVNLYQGEFAAARERQYIYQPVPEWDLWVWNSDYDENLGLGHLDSTVFVC